ncbi:hypothetical protein [Arenimonas sp.]|uniref:hypothetical protein n=1 Tax=Arenimonas sp. TaxID=1872635 RepID=UPI0039E6FF78
MSPSAAEPKKGRGRRRLIVLSMLALLLLVGWWWVDRQLEPHRLASTVLSQLGESLQLELTFEGEPEYALRPEPRLLLPNLRVRDPANGRVFLTAKRAEVSLPWSTITGDGALVITRVELDQPALDVPGLMQWNARRPPAPFELPTLTKGIEVHDGTVRGDGYSLTSLELVLPRLQSGLPAAVTASAHVVASDVAADLQLNATVAKAGLVSPVELQARGTLDRKPKALPFELRIRGRYRADTPAFELDAPEFFLSGESPLPKLDGKARFVTGDKLTLSFDGRLKEWAAAWPALPAPLNEDAKDFSLRLVYTGKPDLSDPLSLKLEKKDTKLDANLRVAQMQAWATHENASPLPPLNARLTTPELDLDGIVLEGVEVEIRDVAPTP